MTQQPKRRGRRLPPWWTRFWQPSREPGTWVWQVFLPVACVCAGLLATTSMVNARGTDLRGGRHSDLVQVVSAQSDEVRELRREARVIQAEIDVLTEQIGGTQVTKLQRQIDRLSTPAGLTRLSGPGLVVALDDAPRDQEVPDGTNPNTLVVHQQDIQAVVNALWAGGAEAMSLQGQRIVSTTGIKCVGNTVVLQGVPYAPPYRVAAVGNAARMYDALLASPEVANYRAFTNPPYNLGWSLVQEPRLEIPAFRVSTQLDFAQPSR